jgi:uncharacterized protein YceK
MKRHTRTTIAIAIGVVLTLTGCSTRSEDTTTKAAAAATTTTSAHDHESGDTVEVTAIDYAYIDLPSEAKVGTAFTLNNKSEAELHEMVAFRLPDDETRAVHEIMMLPQEEANAILEPGLTTVILAPPGGDNIVPVGDGILHEPGRYAILCFIPTGIAPQAYLDAVAATGEPPTSDDPPHFVHGMMGEIVVTE